MAAKKSNRGSPTPIEKRLEVLKDYDAGMKRAEVAAKYGISQASVTEWKALRDKGQLEGPRVANKKTRRTYDDAFRARAVEDFIQRPQGVFGRDIARKHGIHEGLLNAWVKQSRDGKLPTAAEPDRSAIVAAPPKSNGHAQFSAQLHLSMSDEDTHPAPSGTARLPPHLQLYVQRLEAQNKALRKMLQIAMEAI